MKIEMNSNLFRLFVMLVEFMQSNGIQEDVQPVDERKAVGWIEHGAEMFLDEYLGNCHDVWNGNVMFAQLETAYREYKQEPLTDER